MREEEKAEEQEASVYSREANLRKVGGGGARGSDDGKYLLEGPAIIPSMWPPVFWTQVGSCLEDL